MKPRYFSSPERAVEQARALLTNHDWETLGSYYDLSDSSIASGALTSGAFFYRTQRPEVAHPAGFWRYKHPFAPEFSYMGHHLLTNNVAKVTMMVEIDQGGEMQVGYQEFLMRKTEQGYQFLPERDPAKYNAHEPTINTLLRPLDDGDDH